MLGFVIPCPHFIYKMSLGEKGERCLGEGFSMLGLTVGWSAGVSTSWSQWLQLHRPQRNSRIVGSERPRQDHMSTTSYPNEPYIWHNHSTSSDVSTSVKQTTQEPLINWGFLRPYTSLRLPLPGPPGCPGSRRCGSSRSAGQAFWDSKELQGKKKAHKHKSMDIWHLATNKGTLF